MHNSKAETSRYQRLIGWRRPRTNRYLDIFAILVTGNTREELEAIFNKLSNGASEDRFQEPHDMPFGTYGQFFDRYGIHWIFVGDRCRSEPCFWSHDFRRLSGQLSSCDRLVHYGRLCGTYENCTLRVQS